jgi:hypothetical protein
VVWTWGKHFFYTPLRSIIYSTCAIRKWDEWLQACKQNGRKCLRCLEPSVIGICFLFFNFYRISRHNFWFNRRLRLSGKCAMEDERSKSLNGNGAYDRRSIALLIANWFIPSMFGSSWKRTKMLRWWREDNWKFRNWNAWTVRVREGLEPFRVLAPPA